MAGADDWVIALVVLSLLVAAVIIARHKFGRRRWWRVTVVVEHDYVGPDETDGGVSEGPSGPD